MYGVSVYVRPLRINLEVSMEQADQFDLNGFQEKVFANYKVIARQFAKQKTFQDRVSFEEQLSRKTMIRRAFGRLEKYFNDLYFKMPDVVERERMSKAILNNVEVRELLCPLFAKIPKHLSETDAILETIKIISEVLMATNARGEIRIAIDPQLFGWITYSIRDMGFDQFCLANEESY